MNYILFDNQLSEHLLPLTFTRPVAELRIGITTITQKWEHFLASDVSFKPFRAYLEAMYNCIVKNDNVFICGALIPNESIVRKILELKHNQGLLFNNEIIAFRSSSYATEGIEWQNCEDDVLVLRYPYQIFQWNDVVLKQDYEWVTKSRKRIVPNATVTQINEDLIFIEEGAILNYCCLNASQGPIFISKGAEIMEGSVVRGPLAMLPGSVLKLGTKIYGATTIGPGSKVGGELNNVVIWGNSNKAHDGFLGNAVIGEWCNIGADSNNSNLKNNYAEVKLWDYPTASFKRTGMQFCGLVMADHSKCGINTMFNTGTVVGVGANIFGAGFPRNFLHSFYWGGPQGAEPYRFASFIDTVKEVFKRRNKNLETQELTILDHIYKETFQND